MNIFFDCEFNTNDGLDFVSIGLVRADGKTYYATSNEFDLTKLLKDEWLTKHVFPHLGRVSKWKLNSVIAKEIKEFVGEDPIFWGYYPNHDQQCLFGLYNVVNIFDVPRGWPMKVNCLMQMAQMIGFDPKTVKQEENAHDALVDAQWNKNLFEAMARKVQQGTLKLTADFSKTEKRPKGRFDA